MNKANRATKEKCYNIRKIAKTVKWNNNYDNDNDDDVSLACS